MQSFGDLAFHPADQSNAYGPPGEAIPPIARKPTRAAENVARGIGSGALGAGSNLKGAMERLTHPGDDPGDGPDVEPYITPGP